MKFCRECGKKLIPTETGKFDRKTGKRDLHYMCPTIQQGHDGVYNNEIIPERSIFGLFRCRAN